MLNPELSTPTCFTPFSKDISHIEVPKLFTYPFCYQPHLLSEVAASELKVTLQEDPFWQSYFGQGDFVTGKMLGVLVVRTASNTLGYLSAFSGKIEEENIPGGFVPPVFDLTDLDAHFHKKLANVNELNAQIKALEANPKLSQLAAQLAEAEDQAQQLISDQQEKVIAGRKSRKARRQHGQNTLSQSAFAQLEFLLAKESVFEKNELKILKHHCAQQIEISSYKLNHLIDEITHLKATRSTLSASLQQEIFAQYQFYNAKHQQKDLNTLFEDMPHPPPAGSGDCAAPKLLQYAYRHQLTPIAMAEFWWGKTPKSEIREHQHVYPACQGKCFPILSHMLQGLTVEENPMLTNDTEKLAIEVMYEDDDIAIINKPADLLSVPGKTIKDSVYTRMKQRFPKATANLIVHRLDMSTSGLMVIALSKRAQKHLQKQFISRTVKKRYVALIEGIVQKDTGVISLPLRGDFYDRPRQMVCHEEGKAAETTWQVIERTKYTTRLYLFPKTGRTHQLRVHCAHHEGLHMPIVGDDLYGTRSNRLHLHAQRLTLVHPVTQQSMTFEAEPDF